MQSMHTAHEFMIGGLDDRIAALEKQAGREAANSPDPAAPAIVKQVSFCFEN